MYEGAIPRKFPFRHRIYPILCLAAALLAPAVQAQVVFDGNLHPGNDGLIPDVSGVGQPADYQIEAGHGVQAGGNLFHSFRTFSVGANESATFSGPAGLDNIIAAVTGNEISDIQGTVGSTVFGADLWLINPNGVVFGEDARLEVKGGVHVSTADHLTFAGGEIFSASQPALNTLVTADPVSFGFLDDSVGTIESNGALLAVPFVEDAFDLPLLQASSFSIVGGDIRLSGAGAGAPENERVIVGTQTGKIRIASVGSAGELPVDTLDASDFETLGDVRLDEGLVLSSSGVVPVPINTIFASGSGTIDVVANDLTIVDAQILSRTALGSRAAGAVTIELRGALQIESTGGALTPGIQNFSAPAGGLAFGDANGIRVHARTIDLGPRTEIASSTAQFGNAGTIELTADESIHLSGGGSALEDRTLIISNSDGEGMAGTIWLAAPEIVLENGAALVAETRGKSTPQTTPTSEGNIIIGRSSDGTIETERLILRSDARIDTSTRDLRPGGRIEITTRDSVLLSGKGQQDLTGITSLAQPESTLTGSGGTIAITTSSLQIQDGAAIAARSFGDGDAGSIAVVADSVSLSHGSEIATESLKTAGGNITLQVVDILSLRQSQITTSVTTGTSSGGNIDIDPTFVILDRSEIRAQADAGQGGNITIVADFLLADEASVVDASSNLGLDGEVVIRSPTVDLAAELEGLPDRVSVSEAFLREKCAAAGGRGGSGSFIVVGRETLRRSPDAPLNASAPPPLRSAERIGNRASAATSAATSASAATLEPTRDRGPGAPTLFAVQCGDLARRPL